MAIFGCPCFGREKKKANARLDAVSPSILPGTGKFDLNRSATEEEILEAGKLFVLESDIVETEREVILGPFVPILFPE